MCPQSVAGLFRPAHSQTFRFDPDSILSRPPPSWPVGEKAIAAGVHTTSVSNATCSTGAPQHTASAWPPVNAGYLPSHVQVVSCVRSYWAGVDAAFTAGKLHVTLFTSPKGWQRYGPAIVNMVGPMGTGPRGQCVFTFVPVGEDYTHRARAAAAADTAAGAGVARTFAASPFTTGHREAVTRQLTAVAQSHGLDVALAAFTASGSGGGGSAAAGTSSAVTASGGALEHCPAMLVYGGYPVYGIPDSWTLSPPWRMRQDLDARVRRNGWYEQAAGGRAGAVAAATAAWYAALGRRGDVRVFCAPAPWHVALQQEEQGKESREVAMRMGADVQGRQQQRESERQVGRKVRWLSDKRNLPGEPVGWAGWPAIAPV